MSQNSFKKPDLTTESVTVPAPKQRRKWWLVIVLPLWVIASFYLVQLIVSLIIVGLRAVGMTVEFTNNEAVLNATFAVIIYALTIAVVIGVPYLIRGSRVSKAQLGFDRLPMWTDLFLAPAGAVVYVLLSAGLLLTVSMVLPSINLNQVQDTGFNNIVLPYEYILAFITLVIVAPIAEEVLFRGYLYGALRKVVPIWLAIGVVSLLFGIIHGSWNVGIDTFALSIVLCSLRELSGSIYPSILLHMIKNALAFYVLFINPLLLTTLGG